MKKLKLLIIILFLFQSSSLFARLPFYIRLDAGISQASGDGSEIWNAGYNIGLNIFIDLNKKLFAGIRASYSEMLLNDSEYKNTAGLSSSTTVSGSFLAFEGGPYLRYYLYREFDSNFHPFIQFGASLYYSKIEINIDGSTYDYDETNPGLKMGLGILLGQLGGVQIEIFPYYQLLFAKDRTFNYFSANIGILF